MPSGEEITEEWLIRPLSELMRSVGASVVETQRMMDKLAISTQKDIDIAKENGELAYDLKAPWFHIPEVDLELKIALSMKYKTLTRSSGTPISWRLVAIAAPINATYQNACQYDVRATSQIKARIVSIPPAMEIPEEE